jgi:hypothetical protein
MLLCSSSLQVHTITALITSDLSKDILVFSFFFNYCNDIVTNISIMPITICCDLNTRQLSGTPALHSKSIVIGKMNGLDGFGFR